MHCSLCTALQAAANYQEEVRVFKKFHGSVIGKGGATLRKIREDTDTKIELPLESSESDVIRITGRKENVEKAKARILAIEKDMVREGVGGREGGREGGRDGGKEGGREGWREGGRE